MSSLKLVFAGTPAFAAAHLQALLDAGHTVVGVYTQPDRAAGRGKKLLPSPVKQVAVAHDLPVFQPVSLKDADAQATLASLQADLMVVVAYGLILPQAVLDIPRFGCINVHASLLPRWRGAAPIERALLAGDTETGVTIMQMDAGLDTGNMLYRVAMPIGPNDNRQQVEDNMAALGCQALLHTLNHLDTLRSSAEVQDDALSTYARKVDKSEAEIDWQQSAEQINRVIRAGIGRHPAFTFLDGERLRLLDAVVEHSAAGAAPGTLLGAATLADGNRTLRIACGSGVLAVKTLQLPGKNPMTVQDLLNARHQQFAAGKQFTADPART